MCTYVLVHLEAVLGQFLELLQPDNVHKYGGVLSLRDTRTAASVVDNERRFELGNLSGEVNVVAEGVQRRDEVAPLHKLPQGTSLPGVLGKVEPSLVREGPNVDENLQKKRNNGIRIRQVNYLCHT